MTSFTYEFENKKTSLERYEWDNVWWERNDLTDRDRILYIGDSISCATRRFATMESNESILFDGVGTSKSIDNPYFESLIKSFATQQGNRKAIINISIFVIDIDFFCNVIWKVIIGGEVKVV